MKIGIITTWFERGAAYVSRAYMDSLVSEGHDVFIYARGGEAFEKNDSKWNQANVTYGTHRSNSRISKGPFFRWIDRNGIEVLFFNEQRDYTIVMQTKEKYPQIKIGTYVDYYTEETIPWFGVFDFVICNTHRHMLAMEGHRQKYYIPWGTDVGLFKPHDKQKYGDSVVFFHSVGMSTRKGTDILLDAFIRSGLYKSARLVIHTQIPIEQVCTYKKQELTEQYGIDIIEGTVSAPGLYYMGDVYVYPTRLDGLGLTLYEALACGLPVITTDYPPMNEVIDQQVGRLVRVERNYCRADAYYWPMSICAEDSLVEAMRFYIDHPDGLRQAQQAARELAVKRFDWSSHAAELSAIFKSAEARKPDEELCRDIRLAHFKKSWVGVWLRSSRLLDWYKGKKRTAR